MGVRRKRMDSDPRLVVFFMNPLDQSKHAPNDEDSNDRDEINSDIMKEVPKKRFG